jgi:putative flippase GtrA
MAKRTHKRLIVQTAVTSVITAGAEYLVYIAMFALLAELDVSTGQRAAISSVMGSIVGILVNFLLNRFWVFHDAGGRIFPQFLRYLVVTGIGIGAGVLLLSVLIDFVGIDHRIAWCVSNIFVFLVWTYPTNRYLVFPAGAESKKIADPPAAESGLAE